MKQHSLPLPLVGEDFKRWRIGLGWSPTRAAQWLNVPLATYRNWEQDHRAPYHSGPLRLRMNQAKPKGALEKHP